MGGKKGALAKYAQLQAAPQSAKKAARMPRAAKRASSAVCPPCNFKKQCPN
jgi:hypothetical protein